MPHATITKETIRMSTAHVRAECMECGAPIDIAADTPDSHAPCPNCGGLKPVAIMLLELRCNRSNYLLDNFVAHKLSLLTECGARETANANWLNTFILTSVFKAKLDAKPRLYVFNFLRRAEGALSSP